MYETLWLTDIRGLNNLNKDDKIRYYRWKLQLSNTENANRGLQMLRMKRKITVSESHHTSALSKKTSVKVQEELEVNRCEETQLCKSET